MAETHANDKDFNAKLAYWKYLNDLDLETIQILEQDKRARENIENNLTQTDRQNLGERKNLGESENIPTRIETTRSEPIFDIPNQIKTIHKPNVTSDPDPPPSDSSDSSS